MKTRRKVFISVIDLGVLALTMTAFYVYLTPPGLHYLVILYSALGILLLNSIRLITLTKDGRNSIIHYMPYLTILFIPLNSFLANEKPMMMGLVLTSLSLFINLIVAIDIWKPNNFGSLIIKKSIKYFSVDIKAKGWAHKEENTPNKPQ